MTEQKACTLCGAGGHLAAQCNWNKALELLRAAKQFTWDLQSPADLRLRIDDFLASQQGEQCTTPAGNVCPGNGVKSCKKCSEQAEGAKGEREAFEAHESKERRLSPADQKFWFRRGAVADYDIKSIDDAWKAWKARAALAQPALQCKKCGGTGDADSGGIHPWGEAAMVPCDCAHTERARGKRTEDGDTIIDRLRLGGLTIDGDNAYKRDLLDCVVGALAFGFQGQPAPEETHWLHRFWEIGNAEREARAALAQPSPAEDMSVAQELAGVKAILNDMADALKRLTFHARTTGGTAGPDAALMNACERAERILSLGGMGAAFMRGCDEHESQPSPAPELERPEVVAYVSCSARMTVDGWENGDEYAVLAEQASDAEKRYEVPLMTVAQHERILRKATVAQAGQVPDVDAMVSRFLCWRLPDDFHPDCGVSFTPLNHPTSWPVGTNLFTAVQAKAMFEHALAAAPQPAEGE